MRPDIAAANVQVQFRGSGIGFAGDPTGMDIVPLVTVRLVGMQFRPIVLFGAAAFNLPSLLRHCLPKTLPERRPIRVRIV